jgi:hypothetical protein
MALAPTMSPDQAPGGVANAAYVTTQTPPAQASSPLDATSGGRVLNPAVVAPRAPSSRLAPILVGLVALLLLGGAAGAWVVMGKRSHADAAQATSATPTASAAPEDSASASAAPADSASAAPTSSASAAPSDSASAAPAPSDSASAAPSGEPAAGGPTSPATLACDPDCEEIRVDDKPIELGKPVDLAPGKHVVLASKSGYLTVRENIVVKAGEKFDKTWHLKEKPSGAAGPAAAGPPKPCGKFLKKAGCK